MGEASNLGHRSDLDSWLPWALMNLKDGKLSNDLGPKRDGMLPWTGDASE